MLKLLDELLRVLMLSELNELSTPDQVRFAPPDAALASSVVSTNKPALSIYLADLRENDQLRSNGRTRTIRNGQVFETPAPVRADCTYVISAWSPTVVTPAVDPPLDEHLMLYKVATALTQRSPLNPSRVYALGSAALAAWGTQASEDLPTQVLPAEGFPKLAEFWSSMGATARWKPVVPVTVTLPLVRSEEELGPLVTSTITRHLQWDAPELPDQLVRIAGRVLDGADVPVRRAQVRLRTQAGIALQAEQSDERGIFIFSDVAPGEQYEIQAYAPGHAARTRAVSVPSPTGEYDITLS